MNKLFSFNQVSFSYNENEEPRKFALSNFSCEVRENFFCLICGKEASGKTTIIDLLTGKLPLLYGDITINNSSYSELTPSEFKKLSSSFVVVEKQPLDEVIKEVKLRDYLSILLAKHKYKKEVIPAKIDEIADVCNLKASLNKTIEYFKTIDMNRLYLAQGLISSKKVLIIDDIDTLIPAKKYEDFMLYLKKNCKDKSVILTSKTTDVFEDYVDRVLEIEDGFLIQDNVFSDTPRMERDI